MDVYTAAILGSLCVYLLVGNLAGRRVKHLDDYFVAGRNAPTLLVLGTLVASVIGTNTFLGDVGMVYSGYALPMIVSVPPMIIGYVLGALFFGRYLRRAGALTVPEFFGQRFGSRRIRLLAGLTVALGLGGYLMTVNQGAALIVSQLTALSYVGALFVVWAGYSVFTIYAGSRGVIITDTLMFTVFSIVGVLSIVFIADAAGGWFSAMERLATYDARPGIISAESYRGAGAAWSTTTDTWTWIMIQAVAWAVVFAIAPHQSSRYLMARDEHVVIRSACATVCVLAIVWPLIWSSGALIALINPDIRPPAEAMIWAARNAMPALVGAVLLAGVMAAGLSSASTFLSLVGFSISSDVLSLSHPSEKDRLRFTRIIVLTVGLLVVSIAVFVPPKLFWLTSFVGPMFAASWGPIAFMSVWSRRVTEAGAFWGMLMGLICCVAVQAVISLELVDLPVIVNPILVGAIVSFGTIVIVSRHGSVTDRERQMREALHVAPPELADKEFGSNTLVWPMMLAVSGVVASLLLIVFYVRPYQIASGLVSADSFIAWSSELGLVFFFGLVLTGSGIVTLWVTRRLLAVN